MRPVDRIDEDRKRKMATRGAVVVKTRLRPTGRETCLKKSSRKKQIRKAVHGAGIVNNLVAMGSAPSQKGVPR